jgi:polyisoprenyl-phosphate glycosyltransferase
MQRSHATLSVITPAFNEAENLPGLYDRLHAVMASAGIDWEWVLVDDHSRDGTPDAIEALAMRDPRVRGLRFARNHGSHAAIFCGLDYVAGDVAVVLAADLQDPPEIIPDLLRRWREGAEVVWAVRRNRLDETASTLGFARIYYFIMRRIVGLKEMPPTGADFFLIGKPVMDAMRQFRERHVSIFALLVWLGFRQVTVEYDKQPRAAGQSGWTLLKKINLLSDSVTAFSDAPLRAGAATGLVVLAAAVLCAILAFAGVDVGPLSPGWVLLLSGILGVGGLNLLMLGIVGEYLWRALEESRMRPPYVLERHIGQAPRDAPQVSRQHAVE